MMNVGHLILSVISDEDENGSFVPDDSAFNEGSDSLV
jgi:hypothetical protein